jgi:hypothetical protein
MSKEPKIIKISLTGNDIFYYWARSIKTKLKSVLKESNSKKTKKDLQEIIKLFN